MGAMGAHVHMARELIITTKEALDCCVFFPSQICRATRVIFVLVWKSISCKLRARVRAARRGSRVRVQVWCELDFVWKYECL